MAGVLLGVHAGSGVDYNTHAGCDTSLYHNQAVGNIDGCLLYTAASGTCPRPSVLLVVPRRPPAPFQDQPAGALHVV